MAQRRGDGPLLRNPTRLTDLAFSEVRSLRGVSVAAVEDHTVQVAFRAPPGPLRLEITQGESPPPVQLLHGGGAGTVVIEDLPAGRAVTIVVTQGAHRRVVRTATLDTPPGPELARVSTISDLHLGSVVHGLARTMVDRWVHHDPAPLRCARGAITDAAGWGSELLVGKGDLTQNGRAAEWRQLGQLLDAHGPGMARLGLPGNHDATQRRDVEPVEGLRLAGFPTRGLSVGEPECHDLDGVRVVALDSTVEHQSHGSIAQQCQNALELAAEAARAGRALLLCLHHPIERAPVQLQYPRGVRWGEGRRFAHDLARANPRSLITSGHTHRNRVRRVGPLLQTEVASTKDWPGVWGGYAVHEGGIRQVVRRISDPDALGWIDYTRWAALGLWWPYSPGRLSDRCFSLVW